MLLDSLRWDAIESECRTRALRRAIVREEYRLLGVYRRICPADQIDHSDPRAAQIVAEVTDIWKLKATERADYLRKAWGIEGDEVGAAVRRIMRAER